MEPGTTLPIQSILICKTHRGIRPARAPPSPAANPARPGAASCPSGGGALARQPAIVGPGRAGHPTRMAADRLLTARFGSSISRMDPRMMFVALCFSAIAVVLVVRILAQLTVWQIVAAAWSLTVAMGLAGLYQWGILAGLLWSLTHAGQPGLQASSIARQGTVGPATFQCSTDLDVADWQGVVMTAIGQADGEHFLVVLRAGPRLVLQNRPPLGDSTSARPALPDGTLTWPINTGDNVMFSGHLHPSKRCESLVANDGSVQLEIDLTSMRPARAPLFGAPMLLAVSWVVLSIPAFLVIAWTLKRRRDLALPSPAGSESLTPRSFLRDVQPGKPGMDVARLVADCRALLVKNRQEEASTIAHELEQAQPATEAECRLICDLFSAMRHYALEELMCQRFLAQAPDNIEMLVRLVQVLARATRVHERLRAIELARSLTLQPGLPGRRHMALGDIFLSNDLIGEAEQSFRAALAGGDCAVDAQSRLVRVLIRRDATKDARLALTRLREIMPSTPLWHITAAEFSAQLGDTGKAVEDGKRAEVSLVPTQIPLIRRLVKLYSTSGNAARSDAFIAAFDLSNIKSPETLVTLAEFSEQNGLTAAATHLYETLAKLCPWDQRFEAAVARLRQYQTWWQPGTSVAPP